MIKHIITEAVVYQWIVYIVATVGNPVVKQFLRAKNENRLVSVFVILNDRKCGERLTETNAVGKNAAVILFQLIDDGESGITLEIVEFIPDNARLEAGCLVWQYVFRNIFEKLAEDIVERYEINKLRCILLVCVGYVVDDHFSYIGKAFAIVPHLIECCEKLVGIWRRKPHNLRCNIIAFLATEFGSCKLVERHISENVLAVFNRQITIYKSVGNI